MTASIPHSLPAVSLSAARAGKLTTTGKPMLCPEHKVAAAGGVVTTWDGEKQANYARYAFPCGCTGLAKVKA